MVLGKENVMETTKTNIHCEEKILQPKKGMPILLLLLLLVLVCVGGIIWGIVLMSANKMVLGVTLFVVGIVLLLTDIILLCGLKIIRPKEAIVLTLFGKYYGTIKHDGFFWVNPFCELVNPTSSAVVRFQATGVNGSNIVFENRKISLKTMTLDNQKQTVNDELGNPIVIGTIVIWRVVNTAKAVFNVENYKTFLSIQCDSATRHITRLYPYDVSDGSDEKTLRGSSQEIAEMMRQDLQSRVEMAGLEILEVRITHLSYAPEIAAAMLQRQQAEAVIAARQKIVEGAVGMVEMALQHLNEKEVVELDEERKAAMVSNLLVVLCGNRDTQPVVNSGSIY